MVTYEVQSSMQLVCAVLEHAVLSTAGQYSGKWSSIKVCALYVSICVTSVTCFCNQLAMHCTPKKFL